MIAFEYWIYTDGFVVFKLNAEKKYFNLGRFAKGFEVTFRRSITEDIINNWDNILYRQIHFSDIEITVIDRIIRENFTC